MVNVGKYTIHGSHMGFFGQAILSLMQGVNISRFGTMASL